MEYVQLHIQTQRYIRLVITMTQTQILNKVVQEEIADSEELLPQWVTQ